MSEEKKEGIEPLHPAQAGPTPQQMASLGAAGFSITQVTQTIPSNIWTTDVLREYIQALKGQSDSQLNSVDNQRIREHRLAWASLVLVSFVIFAGLWFMYKGIPGGSAIVTGALAFAAGFLAGRGYGK